MFDIYRGTCHMLSDLFVYTMVKPWYPVPTVIRPVAATRSLPLGTSCLTRKANAFLSLPIPAGITQQASERVFRWLKRYVNKKI